MMDLKQTLHSSFQSAFIILKLIIPIYILADILYFYNIFSYIAFIVEPFTSILSLPPETSLAILSGVFLNLYAAIAFAAPLDLSSFQWTILAIFLGVCHSLVVESVIMKKIGIPNIYSYGLRIVGGFFIAYSVTFLPPEWFSSSIVENSFSKPSYESFSSLLIGSFSSAFILSIKVILLITVLIFIMDFIKSRAFIKNSQKNISKAFVLTVGVILGITYGAGILIKEIKSGSIKDEDIFYIGTFLMICHAIIEDTLLFVIFGADFTIVILTRTFFAIFLSYFLLILYRKYSKKNDFKIQV